MKRRKYRPRITYIFTQWKRAAYAVFASLGKLIKIGRLSVATSQGFTLKNVLNTKSLLDPDFAIPTDDFNELESGHDPGPLLSVLFEFLLVTIQVVKAASKNCFRESLRKFLIGVNCLLTRITNFCVTQNKVIFKSCLKLYIHSKDIFLSFGPVQYCSLKSIFCAMQEMDFLIFIGYDKH